MTDTIEYVSHNFACDRETRERGEDWKIAETLDNLRRNFALGLEMARWTAQSADMKRMLAEVEIGFRDVCRDASWASVMDRCKEDFETAKVVPMRRAPNLRLVTP